MAIRYTARHDFDHSAAQRIGVLLVNLGTPDAPDAASVRRYLAQFLWDPRVIEVPRPLWWLILHGVILRIRPKRSARAYASVWTDAGSPLLVHSKAQRAALADVLEQRAPDRFRVALAMRYGRPDVEPALVELAAAGVSRLMVLPMYPQYSATTTGSVFDAVSEALWRRRWVPHLAFNAGYHDHPRYVAALAASIAEHWRTAPAPERLLFSFHGIPRRYFLSGDPYHCHCHNTARLVTEALGLEPGRWQVSFQSRVGREEWLRPYTDETLEQWGREGVNSVHVVCPGFAADCLETLEEIAMENRERFLHAGGSTFDYIPALNTRADHIDGLADIVMDTTAPWQDWADRELEASAARPNARQERARELGAEN